MKRLKHGRHAGHGARFFLALLACLIHGSVWAAAPTLEQVELLTRQGARQLALHYIDEYQPIAARFPQRWLAWEKQRITLLEGAGRWSEIIERLQRHPPDLENGDLAWLLEKSANASLKLGDGQAAREQLRKLLWSTGAVRDPEQWFALRVKVIDAYLLEGRYQDARQALIRLRQDHHGQAQELHRLHSRVLLAAGEFGELLDLLQEPDDPREQVLALLARSRLPDSDPELVQDSAQALLAEAGLDSGLQQLLWGILADSASVHSQFRQQVNALEQGLILQDQLQGDTPLVGMSGEQLWLAYIDLGREVANQQQLLIGDYGQWLSRAGELALTDARAARALYALLAREPGVAGVLAAEAMQRLAELLPDDGEGALFWQLFGPGAQDAGAVHSIPAGLRYRLAETAARRRNWPAASHLYEDLAEPPPAVEPLSWQLQRAGVFLDADRVETAIRVLNETGGSAGNSEQQAVLAVLAARLQGLGRHETAMLLLDRLLSAAEPGSAQRSGVLAALARSDGALGRYRDAAWRYLQAAGDAPAATAKQEAQLQAVAMLMRGGLYRDAANLVASLDGQVTEPFLVKRLNDWKLRLRTADLPN